MHQSDVMPTTKATTHEPGYEVRPIGHVSRRGDATRLRIREPYRPALLGLEEFSHAQVLWWFHRFDSNSHRATHQLQPPFEAPTLGVFALKAPVRPNPIGLSVVEILRVHPQDGVVEVTRIDAYDDTPILDLKAYLPCYDRVADPRVPGWAAGWPAWLPPQGVGPDEVPAPPPAPARARPRR